MEVLSFLAAHGTEPDPRDITYWINLRNDERLPTAQLGAEDMLATMEYEFFSRFDPAASQTYLQKLELRLRRSITEWRAYVGEWHLDGLSINFRSLLCTLWLCARVTPLRQAIAGEARKAMLDVAKCQGAEGAWREMSHSMQNFEQELPSPFGTALAICCLQEYLPESSTATNQAEAVGWMCRSQLADGSWPDLDEGQEGDYWTTLAALNALKNSNVGGLERYVVAGERWLLTQQQPLGVWHGRPFNDYFASVLALEYFSRRRRVDLPSDRFTQAAIELFERADEMLRQGQTTYADRALAVFAAYHAVEFFLYGALQLPAVNQNIFQSNGQTLGLRVALATLQKHLEDVGRLKANQQLSYRTQVSDLANDRDDIVHKAKDIPIQQVKMHLATARKFVAKYSQLLFGAEIVSV
jgi:hypothetical protein